MAEPLQRDLKVEIHAPKDGKDPLLPVLHSSLHLWIPENDVEIRHFKCLHRKQGILQILFQNPWNNNFQ